VILSQLTCLLQQNRKNSIPAASASFKAGKVSKRIPGVRLNLAQLICFEEALVDEENDWKQHSHLYVT